MEVLQTPTFKKLFDKLEHAQKIELDRTIQTVTRNPFLGEERKGELKGIRILKIIINGQGTLLAYQWESEKRRLILLAFGSQKSLGNSHVTEHKAEQSCSPYRGFIA